MLIQRRHLCRIAVTDGFHQRQRDTWKEAAADRVPDLAAGLQARCRANVTANAKRHAAGQMTTQSRHPFARLRRGQTGNFYRGDGR